MSIAIVLLRHISGSKLFLNFDQSKIATGGRGCPLVSHNVRFREHDL